MGLLLAIALLLQDSGKLIRQLGSEEAAVREVASERLLKLGQKALPDLRAAATSSRDKEVRARCSALILNIERNAIWSRIRLVYRQNGTKNLLIREGQKTTPVEVEGNTWTLSPDGKKIYVNEGSVLRTHKIGSDSKAVVKSIAGGVLQVSPDGKRLIVSEGIGQVIELATGIRTSIPKFDYSRAVWLDKERIAYPHSTELVIRIWNVRTKEEPTVHKPKVMIHGMMTPSQKGDRIALATKNGVVIFDPKSGATTRVTRTGVNQNKRRAWSPDDRRLAYVKGDGLAVFDTKTSKETIVVKDKTWEVLDWIDEYRIAFLKIHRVDDTMVRRFGHGGILFYCDLVVVDTRNGKRIAMTEEGPILDRAHFTVRGP